MLFLKWFISACAVFLASYIVPGVRLDSFWSAVWVAFALGLVNLIIKPILIILTLPVNILTLGLFTFVINASLIMLVSSVVKGFEVTGFWQALIFSLVLAILNFVFYIGKD